MTGYDVSQVKLYLGGIEVSPSTEKITSERSWFEWVDRDAGKVVLITNDYTRYLVTVKPESESFKLIDQSKPTLESPFNFSFKEKTNDN